MGVRTPRADAEGAAGVRAGRRAYDDDGRTVDDQALHHDVDDNAREHDDDRAELVDVDLGVPVEQQAELAIDLDQLPTHEHHVELFELLAGHVDDHHEVAVDHEPVTAKLRAPRYRDARGAGPFACPGRKGRDQAASPR